MKRIYLLRHGKSDWDAGVPVDHDRPLKQRGVRAARLMGRFLTATGEEPDVVISSSAVRALATAQLAAESGGWSAEVRSEPALYGAGAGQVLREIQGIDADATSVLLAGHEPTLSHVAGSLIGSAEIRFPTAALARIDVLVDLWTAVEFGRGSLIWFVTPKLLARAGVQSED